MTGPQLKPSTCRPATPGAAAPAGTTACGNQVGHTTMVLRGNTVRGLATQLGRLPLIGRPVIDHTGLTDLLDIELTWAAEPAQASEPTNTTSPSDATSIFTALQQQLGLRLEAGRGPVEVLVIDGVQRPTEN